MHHQPRPCAAARQRGFTLIELMVTVSIVAILGMLAAPSLQNLMGKIRMGSLSTQFTGQLLRARTEAVNRNACTVMCISANTTTAIVASDGPVPTVTSGPSCAGTGSNWQAASPGGWIVFFNEACDDANLPARPEDYLAVQTSASGDYRLDSTGNGQVDKLRFQATGRPNLSAIASFNLYYKSATDPLTLQYGQKICVDMLGRTRTVASAQNC